jgi:hypothetical protein
MFLGREGELESFLWKMNQLRIRLDLDRKILRAPQMEIVRELRWQGKMVLYYKR